MNDVRPAAEGNDLLQATLTHLLTACDVVFGSISILLALFATWLAVIGSAHPATAVALWAIPALNTVWSALTRSWNRVRADLIRSAVCLPIAGYAYVSESGVLNRLWIPALVMVVGGSLSLGIATRRSLLGNAVTFAYAATLFIAAAATGGAQDFTAVAHATGIALTGFVISLVASKLGRTLDEARRQRDGAREQNERAEAALREVTQKTVELTAAHASLHEEMARRAQIEIELRQAQKLESVGRLAAGVAHELNTPIQYVTDSIEFLRDANVDLFGMIDNLRSVQQARLEGTTVEGAAARAAEVETAADLPYLIDQVPMAFARSLDGLARVARIVRAMREFAHPDSTEMSSVDLNRAIESTLVIATNEYKYVADLVTDLGQLPLVTCRIGDINQTILNLVVNAAHAIADVNQGAADPRGLITVRTRRDGDDVVVSVSDTGTGIPDAIRDRIFDPFFTTKEVGKGTGQGLSIARTIVVDRHHGQLWLESEVGKGTTFFLRLPIDQVTQRAAAA